MYAWPWARQHTIYTQKTRENNEAKKIHFSTLDFNPYSPLPFSFSPFLLGFFDIWLYDYDDYDYDLMKTYLSIRLNRPVG